MAQVDVKCLKGLKFTGATSKTVEVNGKKKRVWTPFERDMEIHDILSANERGANIVIVGKDGKKHVVCKNTKPVKAEDTGKAEK